MIDNVLWRHIALRLDPANRAQWFASYITAYIERDLRDLSVVELLGDFQQTMRALARAAARHLLLAHDEQRRGGFVVEHRNRLLAVEVKTTTRPSANDWRHLKSFVTEYGESCHGALLLHAGERTYQVADRVVLAPWWRVL